MPDKIQGTSEIADGFYILNFGFVCGYLLDAGSSAVAFDTGMAPGKAIAESRKLKADPARVRHVLLTHSDRDHVGGLPAFPNAKVYLPRDELTMLDRSFISIDNRRRRESMLRLAAFTGTRLLCTMHSGYTNDFKRAMETWLEESRRAERTGG
jgi:glyoxylase-like metal-dependent hydrolase (beta-lactamase superfamily II)